VFIKSVHMQYGSPGYWNLGSVYLPLASQRSCSGRSNAAMHATQVAAELGDDMQDEIASYDGTEDGNAFERTDPPKLIISGCELSS